MDDSMEQAMEQIEALQKELEQEKAERISAEQAVAQVVIELRKEVAHEQLAGKKSRKWTMILSIAAVIISIMAGSWSIYAIIVALFSTPV